MDRDAAGGIRKGVFEGVASLVDALSWTRLRDIQFQEYWARKRAAALNPLLRSGRKFFSQNDEDGIVQEILRRIGVREGVFIELGVGNGMENNTLFLLANGWRGVWLGGEPLVFEVPDDGPLVFQQSWITRENCVELAAHGLAALGAGPAQLLSIDLDGNDLYVAEALLDSGLRPDVVVLEYNAKFPPPIRWSVRYDPGHAWDGSDYFGASLQSFVDVLAPRGYRLVGCNLTGVSAFFVASTHTARFADVPTEPAELYQEPDYNWFVLAGHPGSPKTVASLLRK